MDYEFWFWIAVLFVTHCLALIAGYKTGFENGEANGVNWARHHFDEIQAMRGKNADA